MRSKVHGDTIVISVNLSQMLNPSIDAGDAMSRVTAGEVIQMRALQMSWAVVVMSLWCAEVACAQAAPAAALSEALRTHLKSERFEVVTSIRGLPLGVRDELQKMFGTRSLDIAEPGAEFQVTDVISKPGLPFRRLVSAGCSSDHCLVYYERGGFTHTWFVALFRWTPEATRLELGGTAPNNFATVDEIRAGVLSGVIKAARNW